jgi:hypothetical protein
MDNSNLYKNSHYHYLEQLYQNSHYYYLENNLPKFMDELAAIHGCENLKWEYNKGIIVAHGDKVTQYKDKFEKKGLNFNQCAAVYLLTYCAPFSKECREVINSVTGEIKFIKPDDWVIDNIHRFIHLFP